MNNTRNKLADHLQGITNFELRATCLDLFPYKDTGTGGWHDFHTWPAAIGMHHAYEGGLAVHTLEVIDTALHIAALYPEVNRDVLITACLWHDVAKIREYSLVGTFEIPAGVKHLMRSDDPVCRRAWIYNSDYAKKIGHIPGSAIMFAQAAASNGVDRDTIDAVTHAILAHHGPVRDWGSPVPPQTIEALILHQADMLSARHGATKGGAL